MKNWRHSDLLRKNLAAAVATLASWDVLTPAGGAAVAGIAFGAIGKERMRTGATTEGLLQVNLERSELEDAGEGGVGLALLRERTHAVATALFVADLEHVLLSNEEALSDHELANALGSDLHLVKPPSVPGHGRSFRTAQATAAESLQARLGPQSHADHGGEGKGTGSKTRHLQ